MNDKIKKWVKILATISYGILAIGLGLVYYGIYVDSIEYLHLAEILLYSGMGIWIVGIMIIITSKTKE